MHFLFSPLKYLSRVIESEKKTNMVMDINCLCSCFYWINSYRKQLFFFSKEPLVYVTKYGECYHSAGCHYLDSVIEKGLYEAQKEGYRACSYCHGLHNGEIEINNYFISSIYSLIIISIILIALFVYKLKNN